MPKIADAYVEIDARTGKYQADITKAKRITAGFGKDATRSLKLVTAGVVGLGVAAGVAATIIGVKLAKSLIAVSKATVSTAIKYDKLKIGLIAVTGSAKEAEIQMKRLLVLSRDPGLGFEQALQGSINLQAAGLSAELSERSLSAFGNALAVVGKGAPDLAGVSLALTQIANKTSGFGQDIRQLQERLPQMQTALKGAFNGKPVEDLAITGKELIAALVVEFEKLAKAGDSVGNNIVNLGTSFDLLKNEIGKTMLAITSDTAKTLTDIIDNITKIIPVWRTYQDEIVKVFEAVAQIAIETTGEMFKGIFAIVSAAAPLVFKPLTNSAKKFFRDFTTGFSVAVNEAMRFIRVINQKEYEAFLVAVVNSNQEANKKAADNFKEEYAAAINSAVNTSVKELPRIGKVFSESLKEVLALTKTITDKIPDAVVEPAAIEAAVLPVMNLAGAFKTFGIVIEANKKAVASLGGVIQENITAAEESIFKAKLVAKELADASRKAAAELRESMLEAVSVIAPAFETLFENLFSGNTKNLWEQFWSDLKRIAIRQIAQIASAQVLAGLFGGGAKAASGGGFGTFLSSFAPLLAAVNPALGGLAAAGGFVAGKLEQPKSQQFNFFQTDFANLDNTRIAKTVSQAIVPAINEERTDGR